HQCSICTSFTSAARTDTLPLARANAIIAVVVKNLFIEEPPSSSLEDAGPIPAPITRPPRA
ncbi:hypothetical protein CO662_33630, partial [Rhizobium anhuiense]